MSVQALMRHSLAIKRLTPTGYSAGTPPEPIVDAWGHPGTYSTGTADQGDVRAYSELSRVKGLVQERTGQEVQGPELQGTVVSNAVIFLPIGTDVTTRDRVRNLDDNVEYDILYVKDAAGRRHHLELDGRRITP